MNAFEHLVELLFYFVLFVNYKYKGPNAMCDIKIFIIYINLYMFQLKVVKV